MDKISLSIFVLILANFYSKVLYQGNQQLIKVIAEQKPKLLLN